MKQLIPFLLLLPSALWAQTFSSLVELPIPDDGSTNYFEVEVSGLPDTINSAFGVEIIWLIYPQSEKVVVYREDRSSITCQGDTVCSAAPVLPEFALPAKDVFKKLVKPE